MMSNNYSYTDLSLKNIKGEKWKFIPGLELYAQVSNYGRIKRLAYVLEYNDARIYQKPDKIIKPVVMMVPNGFKNDHIFFLRVTITLFKQKYNFSIARLVYHCFKKPIDLKDDSIVILTKDRDGLNIKPSNLKKASISEKQKRIFILQRHAPLVITEEGRKRGIANSRLANNIQVSQYDMKGKRIRTFPSIEAASKKTGISNSRIAYIARGLEYSAGGFIWRHGNAPYIDLSPMREKIIERKNQNKESFGQKVSQYTMNGKRVAIFPTINDAVKATGANSANISMVLWGRRNSAGGFFWMEGYGPLNIDLSGHEYGDALRAKRKQRPIMKYSTDGIPLQKFDSIKDAAKAVGVKSTSISGALSGKQISSAGFIWKYI